MLSQVQRTQAPSPDVASRCNTAISHRSTDRWAPKISAALWRIGATVCSLLVIASWVDQALVAMQRPDSRLQIIDKPMQSSMAITADITSSRTNAMPSSIDSGRAWNVLDRAYMAKPLS